MCYYVLYNHMFFVVVFLTACLYPCLSLLFIVVLLLSSRARLNVIAPCGMNKVL